MEKNNIKFINNIGKLYNKGEFKKAISLYEQSLELGINYINNFNRRYHSELHFKIAESYYKLGNYIGAIRHYKKYLKNKNIYFENKEDIPIEKQIKTISDKVRLKYIEKIFLKYGYKFIKSPEVMELNNNEQDFIAVSEECIYFCSIYKGDVNDLLDTSKSRTLWRMEKLVKVGHKVIEDFLPKDFTIGIKNIVIIMNSEGISNFDEEKLNSIKKKANISTFSPTKSLIIPRFNLAIKKHKQKFIGDGFVDFIKILMEYVEQKFNRLYRK